MKKWTLLLFVLSLICMLTGCAGQNEEEEGSGYQIWYVEQDETGLDYERIEVAETDAEGMTGAFLELLKTPPSDENLKASLPESGSGRMGTGSESALSGSVHGISGTSQDL